MQGQALKVEEHAPGFRECSSSPRASRMAKLGVEQVKQAMPRDRQLVM